MINFPIFVDFGNQVFHFPKWPVLGNLISKRLPARKKVLFISKLLLAKNLIYFFFKFQKKNQLKKLIKTLYSKAKFYFLKITNTWAGL